MAQSKGSIPEGAGATTGSRTSGSSDSSQTGSSTSGPYDQGSRGGSTYGRDTYDRDRDHDRPVPHNRSVVLSERESEGPNAATIVGAAIAGAIAGAAIPFMLGMRGSSSSSRRRHQNENVEETVTINRPARELYDFWRDFTNFPQFMDNIRSVQKLDEKRSHWVIEAPAGTSVEFDSRGRRQRSQPRPGAVYRRSRRTNHRPDLDQLRPARRRRRQDGRQAVPSGSGHAGPRGSSELQGTDGRPRPLSWRNSDTAPSSHPGSEA